MMTSHFDRAALPSPRSFYSSEFGGLPRENSKGWTSAECCFHQSETRGRKRSKPLRINVREGNFKCMCCDARGGDVLAFVMLRDGVNFQRAAERLGAWKAEGLSESEKRRIEREKSDREEKRIEQEQLEAEKKRERIAARDLLHNLERLQDETSRELADRERRSPGVEDHAKDMCFANLMLLCDQIRVAHEDYRRLAGIGGEL
jgi:CHC2 zinc finger